MELYSYMDWKRHACSVSMDLKHEHGQDDDGRQHFFRRSSHTRVRMHT